MSKKLKAKIANCEIVQLFIQEIASLLKQNGIEWHRYAECIEHLRSLCDEELENLLNEMEKN